MALLHVLTSQEVMRGRAKRPTPVGKSLCCTRSGGAVCITDKPAKPAQAGLLMTARALAVPASANVGVTIVDAVTIATRHLERGEHDARGYRGHAARHRT
jgi:hypothetical protein